MIRALLFFAGAMADQSAPVAAPSEAPVQTAQPGPLRASDDTIVVTARSGEHPARLGKPLPEVAGPMLPKAVLDLGNGVTAASDVRTHSREGGGEIYLTLKVPF